MNPLPRITLEKWLFGLCLAATISSAWAMLDAVGVRGWPLAVLSVPLGLALAFGAGYAMDRALYRGGDEDADEGGKPPF